jgi:hypothetical protein
MQLRIDNIRLVTWCVWNRDRTSWKNQNTYDAINVMIPAYVQYVCCLPKIVALQYTKFKYNFLKVDVIPPFSHMPSWQDAEVLNCKMYINSAYAFINTLNTDNIICVYESNCALVHASTCFGSYDPSSGSISCT